MKIAKIEDLHCNAGWRDFSFLKITTDEGIVGWSEYNEGYGSAGITAVIRRMAAGLIGENPRAVERIMSMQYAITRQAPGGINQQAMAAIENALLDVKAKSLGVDDKTVASVRRDMQSTSEVPKLGFTLGSDGKYRPAGPAHTKSLLQ